MNITKAISVPFFTNFIAKLLPRIVSNTLATILALFFIGGASRVANYYEVKPVQNALQVVDGVLVQERATVIAQGTTVIVSDTGLVPVSPTN